MTVLLSVQFRNLLPSEELLRCARSRWDELDLPLRSGRNGDANLSISHDEVAQRFHVTLTLPGTTRRISAHSDDALLGIESAFQQLSMMLEQRRAESARDGSHLAAVDQIATTSVRAATRSGSA